MDDISSKQFAELSDIIANQRALGRRFLWLLIVPLVLSAAIVVIFFWLNTRLANVEVLERQAIVERYLQQEDNYVWAISEYETMARRNPSSQVLERLGLLYFQADANDEERAINTLKEAQRMDPRNWIVFRDLTFIYTSRGESSKAIEAGKRALQLNDLDSGTYNNLAWTYATAKDPDPNTFPLAETYALRAVDLTKRTRADYFDTLAQVYIAEGNRQKALESFRKAVALASGQNLQHFQNRLKKYFPNETP